MIFIDNAKLDEYASKLQSIENPIADRVEALFCLRTVGNLGAVEACIKAFEIEPTSDLLKHEICYVLGQMTSTQENIERMQSFLEKVLEEDHSKIVQHEAVEALGNLEQENTLKLMKRYENEPSEILYETCFLTTKLLEWNKATDHGKTEGLDQLKKKFFTNDPAPAFNYMAEQKYSDIKFLEQILLDNKNYDLFERYRALFTLRDLNTKESVVAMCQCLTKENSKQCSALLKHEVAFVLAQMEDINSSSVQFLLDCVANDDEDPIVRHEVLVCLGEIIDDESIISHFLKHPEQIVYESCQVALSYIEYRRKCQAQE